MKLSEKMVLGLVVFFVGLIFFTYLPMNYDYDGTVFSQMLRYSLAHGELMPSLQSHHLLYFPLNYIIYRGLWRLAGYRVLEYFHLQLFSLAFGLAALVLVYLILRRLTSQRAIALGGTVLMAFSFGFWYYSVQAEVDMPALFFLLWCFYLLLPGEKPRIFLAALALALAACFHLTSLLILGSVFFIFLYQRRPWSDYLKFYGLCFLLVLVSQFAFYLITGTNPLAPMLRVMFGVSRATGYHLDYWSRITPASFLTSLNTVASGILYPSTPWLVALSLVVFTFITGLILFVAWRRRERGFPLFALFWLLPHLLFFSLWVPRNVGFKLNVVATVLLLFLYSLSRLRSPRIKYSLLGLFMVLIVVLQFVFVMLPSEKAANNRYLQLAQAIRKNTPVDSVIAIAGCGSRISIYSKIYIPYFGHRRVFILDWMLGRGLTLDGFKGEVHKEFNKGHAVFVLSELTEQGKARATLSANHGIPETDLSRFFMDLPADGAITLTDGYFIRELAREEVEDADADGSDDEQKATMESGRGRRGGSD